MCMQSQPLPRFDRTDPRSVVEAIGESYIRYEHNPGVAGKFETLAERNRELFEAIPIQVEVQESDPYDSYRDMKESVAEEGVLRVFSGGEPHPFFTDREEVMARAVHDFWGHLYLDVDFSPRGEFTKWWYNRNLYPEDCEGVFFVEVVGQLGATHYLPESFESDRFEQKCFEPPEWWIDAMRDAVDPDSMIA